MSNPQIKETDLTLIGEGVKLEGKLHFDRATRIHGEIHGEVEASGGSVLTVGESGVVDGVIRGDIITVDGFVRGRVEATTRLVITTTGRVLGDVVSPALAIEPGGFFEGTSKQPPKSS